MKLLTRLFPGWSASRERARFQAEVYRHRLSAMTELAAYEAGEKTRNTADWKTTAWSADAAILAEASATLPRARAAARNDWAAASILDGWVRNVVGTGIRTRAAAFDWRTNAPLSDFNDEADWWFARWARNRRWCDIERRKTWRGIQALVQREKIAAGQALVLLNYAPRPDMTGLVLQVIEREQLDTSRYKSEDGNREVRNGVEIDDYGAAVAYWIYTKGHPLDSFGMSSTQSVRVPAERVCDLMRQDRPRQSQGITRLAPVLTELWHKKMHKTYTLLRARFEAITGGVIESDPDVPPMTLKGLTTSNATDAVDLNGNPQLTFQPNMLWQLPPGHKLNNVAPQVPGGQYEPFHKTQTREIAAGAGLDYPLMSRDFSGNTFAGQRQGMLESEKETDPEQQDLIDLLCLPVWEAFVTYSILEGRLTAPGFFGDERQRAAYLAAEHITPAKKWIDPKNQASAAQIETREGWRSFKDVVSEGGGDWRQKIRDKAEVDAYLRAQGVTLPAPEPVAPAPQPNQEPDRVQPPA